MTRKIVAIFVALLLTASVCACTGNDQPEESTGDRIDIGVETTDGIGTNDTNETEDTSDIESTSESEAQPEELVFTPYDAPQTVFVMHKNGAVNIRTAPNYNDDTVYKSLSNGTELKRIAISVGGEWSCVEYNGKEYYIGSQCLTTLADVTAGFVSVEKTYTVATASVNVRIAPEVTELNGEVTQYNVVGSLSEGDTVKVIAENTSIGWIQIEFESAYEGPVFVRYNSDWFEGDENNDTVTEGYALYNDNFVSFEYPESWENLTSEQMKWNPNTGDNVNIVYTDYTPDCDIYFSLTNEIFAEVFVPSFAATGNVVSDYNVTLDKKGDNNVSITSFKNVANGTTMYQTQIVTVASSGQLCVITVTEVSADTNIAEALYASLNIK
jgi:uncharacterized protein YgiM (DUF1202 family)